jgi:hypothetical protein
MEKKNILLEDRVYRKKVKEGSKDKQELNPRVSR